MDLLLSGHKHTIVDWDKPQQYPVDTLSITLSQWISKKRKDARVVLAKSVFVEVNNGKETVAAATANPALPAKPTAAWYDDRRSSGQQPSKKCGHGREGGQTRPFQYQPVMVQPPPPQLSYAPMQTASGADNRPICSIC